MWAGVTFCVHRRKPDSDSEAKADSLAVVVGIGVRDGSERASGFRRYECEG